MAQEHKPNSHLSISFMLLCIIVFATGYLIYIHQQNWSWENTAQFGDMWGGVNAIFSGIAIMTMAISIILQRQDLSEQRKAIGLQQQEMELTRAELAKSADAQSATVEHMNGQAKIMKASACLPEIDRQLEEEYTKIHDPSNDEDNINHSYAMRSLLGGNKSYLKRVKDDIVAEIENKDAELRQHLKELALIEAPRKSLNVSEESDEECIYREQLQKLESELETLNMINKLQLLRKTMFDLLTEL